MGPPPLLVESIPRDAGVAFMVPVPVVGAYRYTLSRLPTRTTKTRNTSS